MTKKMMIGLSLCYLVEFTVGNGFLPLMPLYAQMRGATKEIAGLYLAFATLCVAVGVLVGGRVSDLSRHRRFLLAGAGLAAVPMAWLLGRADTLWHMALVNGAQWLMGGACIGIVGAIVGAQADAGHRGRLFGVLGIMIPLGSLVGGLTFGRMVDAWGYPGMSTAVAAFCLIVPAAALLLVREDTAAPVGPEKAPAKVPSGAQWISGTLLLLLCAEILAMIATGVGNMGRSISMHERAFSNGAITTTTAVGGIVSLPIPFVMGWLSDRLGRRKIMNATFLAGTAGVVLLLISRSLWHFCAVAAFMSLNSVSMTVGPAYVADIVKKERRGTGVALLQCSAWIGMIIGYVYSGIAFQRFGMVVGLASAAAVPVLGILVLSFVRTGTGRDMGTRRPLGETVEGT